MKTGIFFGLCIGIPIGMILRIIAEYFQNIDYRLKLLERKK